MTKTDSAVTAPASPAPAKTPESKPKAKQRHHVVVTNHAHEPVLSRASWALLTSSLASAVMTMAGLFGVPGLLTAGLIGGAATGAVYTAGRRNRTRRRAESSTTRTTKNGALGPLGLGGGRKAAGGVGGSGRRGGLLSRLGRRSGAGSHGYGSHRGGRGLLGKLGKLNPFRGRHGKSHGSGHSVHGRKHGLLGKLKKLNPLSGPRGKSKLGKLLDRLNPSRSHGKQHKQSKSADTNNRLNRLGRKLNQISRLGNVRVRRLLRALRGKSKAKTKKIKPDQLVAPKTSDELAREIARAASSTTKDSSATEPSTPASSGGLSSTFGEASMTTKNPYQALEEAAAAVAASFSVSNARAVMGAVKHAPEAMMSVAQMFQRIANSSVEELPMDSGVAEVFRGIGTMINSCTNPLQELSAAFYRAHAEEIRKIESPRPNEDKWDVSKNQE